MFKKIKKSKWFWAIIILLPLFTSILLWQFIALSYNIDFELLTSRIQNIESAPFATLTAICIYIISTFILLPRIGVTSAIVIIFPPLQAFLICISSLLISASLGYFIGKWIGLKSLKGLVGETAQKILVYTNNAGILGITLLRMIPIAPYTLVNIALGVLEVPFYIFIISTLLAVLPGTTIAAFLGFSVMEILQQPNIKSIVLLGIGLLSWVALIIFAHLVNRHWKKTRLR